MPHPLTKPSSEPTWCTIDIFQRPLGPFSPPRYLVSRYLVSTTCCRCLLPLIAICTPLCYLHYANFHIDKHFPILFNFDQMIILFIENIKSLMHLYFFALPLKTKRKLFAPFTRMLILITANSGNCLYSANIISNVRSCGDGLQKNQKPKEAKIHFITNKIVRS